MEKRPWTTPRVLILARQKTEEPVLLACKIASSPSPSGPVYQDSACYESAPCASCAGLVSS